MLRELPDGTKVQVPGPGELTPDLQTKMEDAFRQLPPGKQPFTLNPVLLAQLPYEVRNAVIAEQAFRNSYMSILWTCIIHNTQKCVHCVNGKVLNLESKDAHLTGICSLCNGTGYVPYKPQMRFGCRHVWRQDEAHPAGIVFTPKRHYLCRPCWMLAQGHKLDYMQEVCCQCGDCIRDEIRRIKALDPGLLTDYGGHEDK